MNVNIREREIKKMQTSRRCNRRIKHLVLIANGLRTLRTDLPFDYMFSEFGL